MTCIQHNELGKIREQHRDEKIVYCSGCFDLLHAGHIIFLEDCRKLGDILVVCIGSDAVIGEYKGKNRPIINERARLKAIDSLKPVGHCFIEDIGPRSNYSSSRGFIYASIEKSLKLLKPDLYVINQDAGDIPYRQKLAEKYGVELVVLERHCPQEYEGISTSGIIEKIKRE